jgi:predicted ATPase
MDLKLVFNEDLTLLVGVNGSGKTTALRLIHAVLNPAFEELMSIPFELLQLAIDEQGTERMLTARRINNELQISVSGIEGTLNLAVIEMPARRTTEQIANFNATLSQQCSGNSTFDFLSKLASPLFLGLDRRQLLGPDDESISDVDRFRMYTASRHAQDSKILRGSLGRSLVEVQALIQEAYRTFRRSQDFYTSRLRKSVLLSAFKYTEFSAEDVEGISTQQFQEYHKLLARKAELQQALQNIEGRGDEVTGQLDEFFTRLDMLFTHAKAESQGFHIEWLTNKAQFERIVDLVALIDANRASLEALFAPVHNFIKVINTFYRDSKKEVEVDGVGTLSVIKPNKTKTSIEALSSGERQLMIIFGHLFFNKFGTKSNVFIVDEPELSLHLRWQEIFVPNALSSNPKAQLILATHSPEIVGEYKNKCVQVEVH